MSPYLLTYLLTYACVITADVKEIPIHQIIEIDDAAYLVQMMQDDDQKISYRTYPFGAINAPGFYKLANQVTNSISINSSDVTLDLGGQNVSGGIVVQSNLENIIIKDGTVDVQNAVTDAVKVNSGCKNITVKDVRVKNATISGIFLNQISESCIKNCEMTSNGTGMQISSCNTIVVEKCNALCSRVEGFSLASSTTCSFTNCKAMSTGQGNIIGYNNNVVGFVSRNGSGNIFERCIANSTQALSTTDSNSVIAGFVLRGTEQCSQIIQCESANTTASPSGFTLPQGILLEETFAGLVNQNITPDPNPTGVTNNQTIEMVDWSPDGQYLAVALPAADTFRIRIYKFDRLANTLIQVATPDVIPADSVRHVAWSPDGSYVAIGAAASDSQRLRIYAFDRNTNKLTQVATPNPIPGTASGESVFGVTWSPNGRFVAAALFATPFLRVYEFNNINNTLVSVATPNISPGGATRKVDWSPAGNYILVSGNATGYIIIYRFDEITKQLLRTYIDSSFLFGNAVLWSPTGKFFVTGRDSTTVQVFSFNKVSGTPTLAAQASTVEVNGARYWAWAPSGNYFAFGGGNAVATNIKIFRFDPSAPSITQVASVAQGNTRIEAISWSPDGKFVASGCRAASGSRLFIYKVFDIPNKNVLKNNLVYNNSGGSIPSGVGISGSSIQNMIIENTSYANPINPFMVEQNYVNVTNVFNSLFQDYPTKNQNLGPFLRKPIGAPPDQIAMLNLLTSKLCDIQTKIELLIAANS